MLAKSWLPELEDDYTIKTERRHYVLTCKICGMEETLSRYAQYGTFRNLRRLWVHGYQCRWFKDMAEMERAHGTSSAEEETLQ